MKEALSSIERRLNMIDDTIHCCTQIECLFRFILGSVVWGWLLCSSLSKVVVWGDVVAVERLLEHLQCYLKFSMYLYFGGSKLGMTTTTRTHHITLHTYQHKFRETKTKRTLYFEVTIEMILSPQSNFFRCWKLFFPNISCIMLTST